MDRVNIYASTDIRKVGKADGQYIYIIEAPDYKSSPSVSRGQLQNVTARIAELTALTKALERINRACDIRIFCSNKELARDIRERLSTWAENDYIGAKGESIKDADMWREFYILLSHHKLAGVSAEHNTFSSWMRTELGLPTSGRPQNRENTPYDEIMKITEMVQSLDISEAEESEKLTSAINTLCRAVFEKFKIAQICKNTGFLKIKNSESHNFTSHSGNITIISADKQGISEEMETANTEK